jgi:hypothetical protein
MVSANSDFITVVSGLPRSGTSLMMQMLAAGGMPVLTDKLRQPDEDNPRGYFEFEPVKALKTSANWLDDARGKAVKMVHLLLLDLPREGYAYRILLMRRRISEVLRSQRAMLQRHGKGGASLSDEQLSQVFLSQMQRVENELSGRSQFSVLPVDYNELMDNPAVQAGKINQFLDGKLDPEKMIQAIDSKLYRQKISAR